MNTTPEKPNRGYNNLLNTVILVVAAFVTIVAALYWVAVLALGHQSGTDLLYAAAFTLNAAYLDWLAYKAFRPKKS